MTTHIILIRSSGEFQQGEVFHGFGARVAAGVKRGLEKATDGRAFRLSEERAAIIIRQLDTAYARWLALWHPWNS